MLLRLEKALKGLNKKRHFPSAGLSLPRDFLTFEQVEYNSLAKKMLRCCVVAAGVFALCGAQADAQQARVHRLNSVRSVQYDPGEAYLTAYRLCRESEMLAEKQSYNAALRKGQEAERVLAGIVRDYPSWKVNLVSTRRRLLSENMQAYRKRAREALPIERRMQPTIVELPQRQVPMGGRTGAYEPAETSYYNNGERKLYQELMRAQEECRRMARAYAELNTRFQDVQKKLVAAQNEQNLYKERYEKLLAQVTTERAAGNSVVESLSRQLADMEGKYRHSQATLKEAEKRSVDLENSLAESLKNLERVTRERDTLSRENEQLRAVVELNSPAKTKALLDQNLTLAEQLKTAQGRIKELEAMQIGASDQNEVLTQQLEEARNEAMRLREELNNVYDENMGYRRRISELTEQLNNLEADLAAREKLPVADPATLEENKLLRAMIDKQRKTIAMQEESRRLLIETYRKKNQDVPEAQAALDQFQEQSSPELTENEKKLLEQVQQKIAEGVDEQGKAVRVNLEIQTLVDLANKAFAKGRYVSAEQMYLTLYDMQPDHIPGLVNLGTILLYNNKNSVALNYLTRATRLAPNMSIGYYLSGIAYYRLERMDEARSMFSHAVQLDPGNAEAFFYLANIEGLSGSYERALKHYAAAVKINPELVDAHYNMARLYAETGRMPEAARSYDRAVHGGSMPDGEFEEFLRAHADRSRRPGADLVSTVKPDEEARQLKEARPQEGTSAGDNKNMAQSEENNEQQKDASAEIKRDAFLKMVAEIAVPIDAVNTPSPAGHGHELDDGDFRSIRMHTRQGERTLRLKAKSPQRLRTRGEEQIERIPVHG